MGSILNKKRITDVVELTDLSIRRVRTKSIIENQDDLEECILVWLDSTINLNGDWNDEINNGRSIINNIKIFNTPTDCINFMKMVVNDKIFLIVTHDFVNIICFEKAELRSLSAIYVYYNNAEISVTERTRFENWARNNEPLINGVYLNSYDCFTQLSNDVNNMCDHDSIPTTYLNLEMKNLSLKQASSFLIFHLFVKTILVAISSKNINKEGRQQILRSCYDYYRDNQIRSQEIKNFEENYDRKSAIDWYLKTKFLSRLLHKASRTQNFSILFDYSFLINDIKNIIDENLSTQSNNQQIEIYYRAQYMTADELYHLRANINGIMSINRYLILHQVPADALSEISLKSNIFEKILYHCSLNHSYIHLSEKEIFLSIGTLFRIERVSMEIDGIWHVYLKNIDGKDIQESVEKLINGIDFIPHPYLSIGFIWENLKQSTKADRFYRSLIEHLPKIDEEVAIICNYVGAIYRSKCQYTSAAYFHQQALLIYKEKDLINPSYREDIDYTYAQIGLVYRDMGDLLSAIHYFKLASKLGEEISDNLAEIYRNLEQFQISHQYYEQGKVENNIALCYIYERLFPEALVHIKQDKETVAYINLGFYHQLQKEYGKALIFFDRALEFAKNHPLDTAMIHSYLGLLHCDWKQWELSLKHYQQALDMYRQHLLTNNHPTIALIHDGIGSLYLKKGEYRAAQREFERCLLLQLRVLPSEHPDIAATYNNLGGVFNEMGHYEQALLYHFKALEIALLALPKTHYDIKLYEHNVNETKRKLADDA